MFFSQLRHPFRKRSRLITRSEIASEVTLVYMYYITWSSQNLTSSLVIVNLPACRVLAISFVSPFWQADSNFSATGSISHCANFRPLFRSKPFHLAISPTRLRQPVSRRAWTTEVIAFVAGYHLERWYHSPVTAPAQFSKISLKAPWNIPQDIIWDWSHFKVFFWMFRGIIRVLSGAFTSTEGLYGNWAKLSCHMEFLFIAQCSTQPYGPTSSEIYCVPCIRNYDYGP